jgi:phosphoglycerate dehydrogenase-like enzyme
MPRTKPQDTTLVVFARDQISSWEPTPEFAAHLQARWPQVRVLRLVDGAAFQRELPRADIVAGRWLRAEEFAVAKNLKWIHSFATGVAQMMYPALQQSSVEVTNAGSVHCVPIAEYVLGGLIALSRRFPDCMRYQQHGRWMQQELWKAAIRPRELRGQVLLFIGFGAIGRAVAAAVRPMEMRVWAVTRSGRADPELAEKSFPTAKLHDALAQADFVVVAAPDLPETRGMIGARELALMKPTAYLMNVARGVLVDEPALITALERHAIAGAMLDVTSTEPLPTDSPLWKLDNAFITPHVSALSEHVWERQEQLLNENLERWFSERELLNRVDVSRGY